jgi:uncharacterized protein (UPF0335 family)
MCMKIKDDLIDTLHGMLVRLIDMGIEYNISACDHYISFYLNGIKINDDDINEIYYSIEHVFNFLKNYGFNVKILSLNEDLEKSTYNVKTRKEINLSDLKKDLRRYQKYIKGSDKRLNGSIIISFSATDRCYNHIYPKGSKMLDKIGGYHSAWNKTFKDVGEVGNFNESKLEQTPSQVKFFEIKSIIEDLYGILVELDDEQIFYLIEPNCDLKLRSMTLLNNFRNVDFSIMIGKRLYLNEEHIDLIYDRIESIVSYMKIKGYDTTIKMKTLLKMRTDNLKLDKSFERFYYKYFEDTDYIELKFTPLEVNESLPRKSTVDQLKKVMKLSAKTDIGNRISDMNKQGSNISYIRNPIDSGIESYEDFEKHNKKFVPSWNLKHLLSPFSSEIKKKNKK